MPIKRFKHWIVDLSGTKLYLGHDLHLGYETLYKDPQHASKFTTDKLFDVAHWTGKPIINRGCIEVTNDPTS